MKAKIPDKGVYCIVMNLDKDTKMQIGKLGAIQFSEGSYCYVGSALNNLKARLERHASKNKKMQWHIDYFLKKARLVHMKTIKTNKKIECKLNKAVSELADETPIRKFGSKDCKCKSHFHYFKLNPIFEKEFHDIFEKVK
ncbi:MAG: GIY-YIG nuclease family protein [Candidatus Aenigmarchaeota archaeon]|nr:GIY-YIG nuclease family protein [Candidatus Aenigmarchaeota archaeon]